MKTIKFFAIIFLSVLVSNCSPLKPPTITKNDSIEKYKYVFVTPTSSLTSTSGNVYGGRYSAYGSTNTKTVNPSDIIKGSLLKNGFIILPELKNEFAEETLIINYGESGRRNRGMGYTIEVTIQFISAKSNMPVSSCSAEGQGETEADDIRIAINRCLSGLLEK